MNLPIWRFALLVVLCVPVVVKAQDQPAGSDADSGYSIHVVQRGENLFRIALTYGLTAEELAAINGIENPANIQVGQRLLVPDLAAQTGAPGTNVTPVAAPTETETVPIETDGDVSAEQDTPLSIDGYLLHTVLPGETLFRIATAYGSNVNDVSLANSITDPTRIFPGQQLIIPNVAPPDIAETLPAPVNMLRVAPLVFSEGKTGQVRIRTDEAVTIAGTFLGQDLRVVSEDGDTRHLIWIGIPTFTEAGVYPLRLTVTSAAQALVEVSVDIQVVTGVYGSERINLIEGRDGLLNENVEDAEMALLRDATQTFTLQAYFNGKMGLPAAAAITSGFGTRRSYNGGAFDRYHSGTDFAGAPGTPILAPAPGRVVLADSLNVRGNATMIDHGWGVYTGYWHQTDIYVAPGELVETGQVIGTIGSTGRVTGAHLHWELWVHGVPVDPMQWVQQSFFWEA